MIVAGKALAILVGKEVLEFLVVDSTLKLIGQSAKGRSNKMATFEQIRAAMAAKTTATSTTITNTAASVTNKVVETAKSVSTSVAGVLPVTNNKLDDRTEKLLTLIEEQGLQIDTLFAMFKVEKPGFDNEVLSALVAARMQAIKHVEKKHQEPVGSGLAIQPEPSMPNVATPVTEAPSQPGKVVQSAADTYKKVDPNSIPMGMSTPTNWHLT